MKLKLFRLISLLSLLVAAGAVSGANYQRAQAVFSYSFIVIGGTTSKLIQLTANPNGKGVLAFY